MDASAAAGGASAAAPAAANGNERAQPRAHTPRSRSKGGSKSAKNGEKKRNGDVEGAGGGDRKAPHGAADDNGGTVVGGAATQPPKVKEGGNGGASSSSREKQQQQKVVYKKKEQRLATSADPQPQREGKKKPREERSADYKPHEPATARMTPPPAPHASSSSAGDTERNQSKPKNPKPNHNAESEHEKEKDTPLKKPPTTGSTRKERDRKNLTPEEKEDNESKKAALIEQFTKDLATPAHFREAEWFTASGGDLRFAQWLFGRSQGIAELNTVQDAVVLKRVHRLYCLEKKIQQELQNRANTTTADDADDNAENNEDKNSDALDEDDENGAAAVDHGSDGNQLWTAAAIVTDVRAALRVSRYEILKREEERKSSSEPKQKQRSLEQVLVKELIENTTELLLNRASFEDIVVLESWMAFLNQDVKELGNELGHVKPEPSEIPEVQDPEFVNDDATTKNDRESKAKPSKRELKRQQKQRESGKNPDTVACEQLRTCINFLQECHRVAEQVQSGSSSGEKLQPPTESPVADLLVNELNRIYLKQRINEFDEARRIRLTQEMQQLFRKKMDKWQKCNMILFGSSLSLYGSISSDLDMCFIANPSVGSNNAHPDSDKTKVIGARELRLMLDGKTSANSSSPGGGNGAMDMVALQELLLQVKKSIEKITKLHYDLAKDKSASESRGQLKQMQQLRFFRAHFKLLQDAINDRAVAIGNDDNGEAAAAIAKAAAARIKEIMAKSRRQSDDMFRVKAILERSSCQVRMVISGARIPIIRFQHLPTKLECDMCFENVLAMRNTFLLRAYAAFDERARVLGMAIKHWAKQRAISDASMGFLSSYSYVLLTVYFLQAVAGVLPNLQDPELLAEANVAPDYYNGVNIAFCVDKAAARRFHEKKIRNARTDSSSSSSYSLSTLLVWFFEFYATKFDFARRVIAIRSPDTPIDKRINWGAQKAKSWRISIQDPLEIGRDLGCVLQFKGQENILQEFKRGYEMLRDGKNFVDVAGESVLVLSETRQSQKTGKKDSKGKAKGESRAPYSLMLWSHDVNLGKSDIQRLLRSIDSAIRVGVIEKVVEPETDMKLKKWRVELMVPKGPAGECPRALKLKSRVDFVSQVETTGAETVDVTDCVMWLHHQSVFQHAPCSKCCSPEHPVHECNASKDNAHENHGSHSNAHVLRVVIADTQRSKHSREEKKSHPSANKGNIGAGGHRAMPGNNGDAIDKLEAKKPSRTKNDRNTSATRKARMSDSDASPPISREVEVGVVVAEAT